MSEYRVFCLVSIIIIALFSVPNPISADLPPPIEVVTTDSGGLYTIATNISMPYAEVNASIHLSGAWYYNISVSCEFYILSLVTQNLTTAFVYPSVWSIWTEEPSVWTYEVTILVNQSLVNHTILSYDEYRTRYDANQTDWEKVDDCDFATFNFTIDSGEPLFIDVLVEFTTYSPGHVFQFDYIVDTARGWQGDSHEIVNIDFSREIDTEIVKYWYSPNESLVFSGSNYTADLTWDFHISSFTHDRVVFWVQQQEYPEYTHVIPPIPYPVIVPFLLATTLVLIVVVLRIKGRI
ncbi:MAG: hypothetical protein ACFFF9_16465 [Candidatus Thorarchaeota archaeon]